MVKVQMCTEEMGLKGLSVHQGKRDVKVQVCQGKGDVMGQVLCQRKRDVMVQADYTGNGTNINIITTETTFIALDK